MAYSRTQKRRRRRRERRVERGKISVHWMVWAHVNPRLCAVQCACACVSLSNIEGRAIDDEKGCRSVRIVYRDGRSSAAITPGVGKRRRGALSVCAGDNTPTFDLTQHVPSHDPPFDLHRAS